MINRAPDSESEVPKPLNTGAAMGEDKGVENSGHVLIYLSLRTTLCHCVREYTGLDGTNIWNFLCFYALSF